MLARGVSAMAVLWTPCFKSGHPVLSVNFEQMLTPSFFPANVDTLPPNPGQYFWAGCNCTQIQAKQLGKFWHSRKKQIGQRKSKPFSTGIRNWYRQINPSPLTKESPHPWVLNKLNYHWERFLFIEKLSSIITPT